VPTTAVLACPGRCDLGGDGRRLLRYEEWEDPLVRQKGGVSLPDVRAVVEGRGGECGLDVRGRAGPACMTAWRSNSEIRRHSSDYVQSLELDEDGRCGSTYGPGFEPAEERPFSSISTEARDCRTNFICDNQGG